MPAAGAVNVPLKVPFPPEVGADPAVVHGPKGDELYSRVTIAPSGMPLEDDTWPEKGTPVWPAWIGEGRELSVVVVG